MCFFSNVSTISMHMQMMEEFDRVVEPQKKTFLACKLRWLECVPNILVAARKEKNVHVDYWIQLYNDSNDEGTKIVCAYV